MNIAFLIVVLSMNLLAAEATRNTVESATFDIRSRTVSQTIIKKIKDEFIGKETWDTKEGELHARTAWEFFYEEKLGEGQTLNGEIYFVLNCTLDEPSVKERGGDCFCNAFELGCFSK